jgi:8-oxo-dGTP diphosphatase
MSQTRYTLPVAVFIVLVKDDKVLLTRRQNTGWYDGSYDLPSGHIDGNESLRQAVQREAAEEVGVQLDLDDAKFVHLDHSLFEDGKEYLYIVFEVTKWQGEPRIMEPDLCDDLQWFPKNKLPENITPGSRAGLEAYASGKPYSEHGFVY